MKIRILVQKKNISGGRCPCLYLHPPLNMMVMLEGKLLREKNNKHDTLLLRDIMKKKWDILVHNLLVRLFILV
jgi:hypothetical protein